MKAKLIKTGSDYLLRDMGGNVLAITNGTTEGRKLSKQNCDEIFGVVDVEKLAEYSVQEITESNTEFYLRDVYKEFFKDGFDKAMELNKDKVFTLEDMINCWNKALKFQVLRQTFGEYIQSLQQPTEIEVEIEMEKVDYETKVIGAVKGVKGSGDKITTYKTVPKLDSEGCLILKINKSE
jgi:hypothetical protein